MRILLAGGGTAGHVYPALSVAEALRADAAPGAHAFLFAGTLRGDVERLATQAGVPFVAVRAAPIRGRSPLALAGSLWQLAAGTVRAWRVVGRFRPRVVLATGGYASVPVSLAARLRGVPLVVYLPDVYPGWAVRLLVRMAKRVATTSEGALVHLPRGKTRVTGYPVRAGFWSCDRARARAALDVRGDLPLLLVTGASQGSHALNEAVFAALPRLLPRCTLLHQTGHADLATAETNQAALPAGLRERYRPLAYLDDMPQAMLAADLAVMRAGASSLAEPPAAALPAVLVPGTYAGAHQHHNAAFMAGRGAAVLLEEARLAELAQTVLALLDDPGRLDGMRGAALALAVRDAARRIARVVLEAAA